MVPYVVSGMGFLKKALVWHKAKYPPPHSGVSEVIKFGSTKERAACTRCNDINFYKQLHKRYLFGQPFLFFFFLRQALIVFIWKISPRTWDHEWIFFSQMSWKTSCLDPLTIKYSEFGLIFIASYRHGIKSTDIDCNISVPFFCTRKQCI